MKSVLLSLFLALAHISFSLAKDRLLDRIVAVVGNDIITASDLARFREDLKRQNILKASGQADEKALRDDKGILSLLLRDKLMDQAIKRLDLKAGEDEIELMINRIQKQNNLNRGQLQQALKAQGMSYELFRDNIRKQIEQQNLVQKEIRQKVEITEQDLYNYYLNHSSHAKDKPKVAEVRISHLLLHSKAHGGAQKTLAFAEDLVKKMRAGSNFEELVRNHSEDLNTQNQGGDLGHFKTDSLHPKFAKALQSMRVGEVSDPIVIEDKIHLLKLTDLKILDDEDFKSKKEQIRALLQKNEFDRQLELWFEAQTKEAHVKMML